LKLPNNLTGKSPKTFQFDSGADETLDKANQEHKDYVES